MADPRAYTSYSDEQLVPIVISGDRHAFALLMQRYLHKIRRLASSILNDPQEAEDAVQEVFVTLLESLDKFNPNGDAKFSSWIYRVAFNKTIDLKRKKRYALDVDEIEMPSTEKDGYQLTLENQVSQRLIKSMKSLPDRQYDALFLFYYKEMSVDEISAQMKKTQESVKSLLKRGRTALREKIENEAFVKNAYQLLAA